MKTVARWTVLVLSCGWLASGTARAATATLTVSARLNGVGGSGSSVTIDASSGQPTLPAIQCFIGSSTGCAGAATVGGPNVVLRASEGTNQTFVSWSGCTSAAGPLCTVAVTGARSIVAVFKPTSFALTVNALSSGGGTGSVTAPSTPDPVACTAPSTCVASVANGQSVVLTASAGPGSRVAGFGGCATSSVAPDGLSGTCQVTLTAARTVNVTFGRAAWDVSVAFLGGHGSVAGAGLSGCASGNVGSPTRDCATTYAAGSATDLVLTATPDLMSLFDGWNGCTSASGSSCTLRGLTRSTTVTAAFRPKACQACHGVPPPPPHMQVVECGTCHTGYTSSAVNAAHHLNGTLDVAFVCGACHAVPPADSAHVRHSGAPVFPPPFGYGETLVLEDYRPGDLAATEYMFGCGLCHPVDPARHLDGTVQVEVSPAGAPAGSLRAANAPTAAYQGVIGERSGSCSGVSCHASGQATPVFAHSPAWNTSVPIDCDACHGNPPRYPSGGAGTATANTHVVVADDGWVSGHFAGFMGPWNYSSHGRGASAGQPGSSDSAPITCQTCHFESVDPHNTGPSGFYYLDTTGNYAMVDPATGQPAVLQDACQTCHTGLAGAPPQGWGKARPLRHVNGRRDVVFDARDLPGPLNGYTGAPAGASLKPYWYSNLYYGAPRTLYNGAVFENGTWSVDLKAATYEPATKTCSNVACHLQESNSLFPSLPPLQWGRVPVGWATCDSCHGYGRP